MATTVTSLSVTSYVDAEFAVLSILLAMLAVMALAGLVVLYVAFPYRGEDVPHSPWVGDALRKGVDKLPTLDNLRARERETSDV